MTASSNDLMDFQEFLMDTLYTESDVTILQKTLQHYPSNPHIAKWLENFTPHMLEVAARMTQHWGKR